MKKKLAIVFLFLILLVSLTACSGQKELPGGFDFERYSNDSLGLTKTVGSLEDETLEIYSHDATDYLTRQDLSVLDIDDVEVFRTACAGTLTAKKEAGTPIQILGDITYELSGVYNDIVTIIIPVQFTNRTVNYEYTFEPNPKAEYNSRASAYIMTQAVVSTQYSKAELMQRGGMNTIMGMGVVFLVLIFISFIISMFKYMPGKGAKKRQEKKSEAPKEAVTAPFGSVPEPAKVPENLMDDQELVAVITAAILAADKDASNRISSDRLIVRSIKRAYH